MAPKIDLAGRTFGGLTVLGDSGRRGCGGQVLWACRCCCGREVLVLGAHLRSGNSRSCGCQKRVAWYDRVYNQG